MDNLNLPTVFTLNVPPKPKERPRGAIIGKGKKSFVRMYTPQTTLNYQDALAKEMSWALDTMPDRLDEPIVCFMHFYKKTRRKMDVDNLVKSTMDAFNDMLWTDDHWVYELHASMDYDKESPRQLFAYMKKSEYDKDPIAVMAWWLDAVAQDRDSE